MIIFVLKEGVDGQVVRRRCIPLFHMKSRYVRIAREMNLEKLSVGKTRLKKLMWPSKFQLAQPL